MAKILNKDPYTYQREHGAFLRELKQFHEGRGTPFKRAPRVNGKEIDLYLLYSLVTAHGGWEKVNDRDEWELLCQYFNIPVSCVNGGVALKQIYLRHLDHYEKIHYHGEDPSAGRNEDVEGRHRRKAVSLFHNVPLVYNVHQHNVPETNRTALGMSANLYQASDYDKLGISLLSPLPNEHDFAINVCTLLSNEGKHTLKLDKYPRLVDFLLLHAGVFNHGNLRQLHYDNWSKVKAYNLVRFWEEVIDDFELQQLLDIDTNKTIRCVVVDSQNDNSQFSGLSSGVSDNKCRVEQTQDNSDVIKLNSSFSETIPCAINSFTSSELCDTGERKLNASSTKLSDQINRYSIEPEDKVLFCLTRLLGVQDKEGQRIQQIALIVRNLSFEECNQSVLARNAACLKFLILCTHSNYGTLPQYGFDTLANISTDIRLEDPNQDALSNFLLRSIIRAILGPDRNFILGALECLNKLAQQDVNEEVITSILTYEVYHQICLYLSLQDILMLIQTLECLYSLTSLGEKPCNWVSNCPGTLYTLMSLLTVEGQSYGPKACVLMKVVETGVESSEVGNVSSAPSNPPSKNVSTLSYNKSGRVTPQSSGSNVQTSSVSNLTTPVLMTTTYVSKPPPVTNNHYHLTDEREIFLHAWLKANIEPCASCSIEQCELYKLYLHGAAQQGKTSAINAQEFACTVRLVFGNHVGPVKKIIPNRSFEFHYEGIKKRPMPLIISTLPVRIAPAPATNNENLRSSPILKAQLSSPAKGPATTPSQQLKKDVSGQVPTHSNSHHAPVSSPQVYGQSRSTDSSVTTKTESSSLIRSLLATKVNQNIKRQKEKQQCISNHCDDLQPPAKRSRIDENTPVKDQVVSLQQCQLINQDSNHLSSDVVSLESPMISSCKKPGLLENGDVEIQTEAMINGDPMKIATDSLGFVSKKDQSKVKGILAEMLERKICKEPLPVNGVVEKEIRISDKGLELVVNHVGDKIPLLNGDINEKKSLKLLDKSYLGLQSNPNDINFTVKTVTVNDTKANGESNKGSCGEISEVKSNVSISSSDHSVASHENGGDLSRRDPICDIKPGVLSSNISELRLPLGGSATANCVVISKVTSKTEQRDSFPISKDIYEKSKVTQPSCEISSEPTSSVKTQIVCFPTPAPKVTTPNNEEHESSGMSNLLESLVKEVGIPDMTDFSEPSPPPEISSQVLPAPVLPNSNTSINQILIPNQGSQSSNQVLVTTPSIPTASAPSQEVHHNVSIVPQTTTSLISSQSQPSQTQLMLTPTPAPQNQPRQYVFVQTNPAVSQGQYVVTPNRQMVYVQTTNPTSSNLQQSFIVTNTPSNMVLANSAKLGTSTQVVLSQPLSVSLSQTNNNAGLNTSIANTVSLSSSQSNIKTVILMTQQGQKVVLPAQSFSPSPQNSSILQVQNSCNTLTAQSVGNNQLTASVSNLSASLNDQVTQLPGLMSPKNKVSSKSKKKIAQHPGKSVNLPSLNMPPSAVVDTSSIDLVVASKSWPKEQYICEWKGCSGAFCSAQAVYLHACKEHCPPDIDELPCMWDRCDGMKRKRFSMMTHLLDRHCNEQVQTMLAARRKQLGQTGRPEVTETVSPAPHPGYAPNAALQAIRRHALETFTTKDAPDENEGPVTKSIRLTAALILRNIGIYSSHGRRFLKAREFELTRIAMSNLESSRTIAQVLYDLSQDKET